MNKFANTSNSSALLKDVYKEDTATSAMKQALANRKKKMIINDVIPADPTYTSKDAEEND